MKGVQSRCAHYRDSGRAERLISLDGLIFEMLARRGNRAVAFFKMRIGWHGLGVLAMAVSLTSSHGHPEDGKTVAPEMEIGD